MSSSSDSDIQPADTTTQAQVNPLSPPTTEQTGTERERSGSDIEHGRNVERPIEIRLGGDRYSVDKGSERTVTFSKEVIQPKKRVEVEPAPIKMGARVITSDSDSSVDSLTTSSDEPSSSESSLNGPQIPRVTSVDSFQRENSRGSSYREKKMARERSAATNATSKSLLLSDVDPDELVEMIDQKTLHAEMVRSVRSLHTMIRPGDTDSESSIPFKPGKAKDDIPSKAKVPRSASPGIGKYAAVLGFLVALGWALFLFITNVQVNSSFGRVILELFFAVLSFFAVLWNSYCLVNYIMRLTVTKKHLTMNGKFYSVIPEEKDPNDEWPSVTIQIPVYKENFDSVMLPTLTSCLAARDDYREHTGAHCNLVICEDGLLNFLKNDVDLYDRLWSNICAGNTDWRAMSNPNNPQAITPADVERVGESNLAEVVRRLDFYFANDIGFTARTTHIRRGKFKKAGNLNHHIRTVFAARSIRESDPDMSWDEAIYEVSREMPKHAFVAENDVNLGDFIVLNDSDARMSPQVIRTTMPEFLNDETIAFTQHSTKTLNDQRENATYFVKMLAIYTDALYQLHFLLMSAMGYHPPLVGHSAMLRTSALEKCARLQALRLARGWLNSVGLETMGLENVGLGRLQDSAKLGFWSESHISEDFELMMNFYNAGYSGRYVSYPNCEFQEGVTLSFDDEAVKMRKFSTGAHELVFNPFGLWISRGMFSDLYRRFLRSEIPNYYKLHLMAYLFSYFSMGIFFTIVAVSSIAKLAGLETVGSVFNVSPVAIFIINQIIYTLVGLPAFFVAIVRVRQANPELVFAEYRDYSNWGYVWEHIKYYASFQSVFYYPIGNYFFLGAMDHLFSRKSSFGATNKEETNMTFRVAMSTVAWNNLESWIVGFIFTLLGTLLLIFVGINTGNLSFAVPLIVIGVLSFLVPLLFNPQIWISLFGRSVDEAAQPEGGDNEFGYVPEQVDVGSEIYSEQDMGRSETEDIETASAAA